MRKSPWREVTTMDGYICLLNDDGQLHYGLGYDNESPLDVGEECDEEIVYIGKRWELPK